MAKTWDDNPMRQQLTQSIFDYIQKTIPLHRDTTVLDYGCGTGLLSFLLSDTVKSVHAVDTSSGMLEQLKGKIAQTNINNISVDVFDAENDKLPDVQYDLIVSAMTLHHLQDVEQTITKLISLISPGGWIALADLYKEDGSFHTEVKVKHFGFEPSELENILRVADLKHITAKPVFEIARNERTYPIFCISGYKAGTSVS